MTVAQMRSTERSRDNVEGPAAASAKLSQHKCCCGDSAGFTGRCSSCQSTRLLGGRDEQRKSAGDAAARHAHDGSHAGHDFSNLPLHRGRSSAQHDHAKEGVDTKDNRAAADERDHDFSGTGAAIGGVSGAILGAGIGAFGGPIGALIGGLIGAGIGAIAGGFIGGAGGSPKKTRDIYAVSLPGSTRSPDTDVTRANAIWATCSLGINLKGSETWTTNILDQDNPKSTLNEFSDPASPTAEEIALLAHQPGGAGVIHAYYVPAMSAGSRGEAFTPSDTPALPEALVISDSAAEDTLAHELGHIVLNDGNHHADPDNLMASGTIRNVGVDKLEAAQCSKV